MTTTVSPVSISTTPRRAAGVTVWMDEHFGYVMAYTADTVEPAGRRRQAMAIEPMTCPPDALRSGTDLVRLEPGASWRATWGIAPADGALTGDRVRRPAQEALITSGPSAQELRSSRGNGARLVDAQRVTEEETLGDVAAEGPQGIDLVLGLDPLGHTQQAGGSRPCR